MCQSYIDVENEETSLGIGIIDFPIYPLTRLSGSPGLLDFWNIWQPPRTIKAPCLLRTRELLAFFLGKLLL